MAQQLANATEVKASLDGFYSALNKLFKGDYAQMSAVWSHSSDVSFLGPQGNMLVGWEQVSLSWKEQAALTLGGKVDPENIHVVQGEELAIVQNEEVGTNFPNSEKQEVRIRATHVFRKEKGEWKMISHHTDLLPFLTR